MRFSDKAYRAVAIGHTGRGNYGHYIDTAFGEIPSVALVAVADPDENGRREARARNGAEREYADYHEMLERERPDLALVCPRWPDQHRSMIAACAEAGVRGIYSEKPIAPTLADADAIRDVCRRHGVRVVVAHRSGEIAYMQWARDLIARGEIGRLEALKAHGKCDRRAGGMDLAVLGQHLFDEMRVLAGPATWVHAQVMLNDRPVTRADAVSGDEGVGLIAGNRISATFGFANGVVGYYETYPGEPAGAEWYGVEVHCARGILAIRNLPKGEVYRYPHGFWMPDPSTGMWEHVVLPEWVNRPDGTPRTDGDFTRESNRRIALSLLRAIDEKAEPRDASTLDDAIATQEMIAGIYASHLAGSRVALPFTDRQDPLAGG